MPTPVFPGQFNTFIPSTEATQNMVVDFSRNVDKFPLAKYVQYVPVGVNKGFYTRMTIEQAGRLLTDDGADALWADGTDAPRQTGKTESFSFEPYVCKRYADGFEVGEIAAEQASWDLLAQQARITAQRVMTRRTNIVLSQAADSTNYAASQYVDVSNAGSPSGGAALDASGATDLHIKKTLDYCALNIVKNTLSAVSPGDIQFVMNPETARLLSDTQEIRDFVKQNVGSFAMIEGNKMAVPGINYGLPATLYGYNIVVEDTVKVSGKKGATATPSYALANGSILALSRVGGLEGVEGARSFSTWQLFLKDEMIVEQKHDNDHKRHVGRIIDHFDVRQVAPISGMLIENALT